MPVQPLIQNMSDDHYVNSIAVCNMASDADLDMQEVSKGLNGTRTQEEAWLWREQVLAKIKAANPQFLPIAELRTNMIDFGLWTHEIAADYDSAKTAAARAKWYYAAYETLLAAKIRARQNRKA